MATRHNDNQLRIRIARLTATSPACKRFISEHDELTGTARIERHIDVIRMGQMMLDLDLSKELAFIDDEIWQKMSIKQRRARFFEVLALKGKVASGVAVSEPEPHFAPVPDITPVSYVAASEVQTQPVALQPEKKHDREPLVNDNFGTTPVVKAGEDGSMQITQPAPAVTPKIKGLGGGA